MSNPVGIYLTNFLIKCTWHPACMPLLYVDVDVCYDYILFPYLVHV